MNLTTQESLVISAVIPAYNESQGIAEAIKQIAEILGACESAWEIIIVDDGSRDQTYQQICQLSEAEPRIKGLTLSRNFGKEAAMLAGLEHAAGEAVITLDADLQHPPDFIPEMIEKWRAGAQIVHAFKRSRKEDSAVKKAAAYCINHLISTLGKIDIKNSSDFKLLDREIVDIIIYTLPERERFFAG
jgi:polyisoprenyl-phosphate glycosyltransferase